MATNLEGLILADLHRAQRLIEQIGGEPLDPQFRIATPEGDYWVALTLDDDIAKRTRQMQLISAFMVARLATGFIMATELHEPDAVCAAGVTRHSDATALSRISRNPLRFAEPEWLPPAALGEEVRGLLPPRESYLDQRTLDEVDTYFGPSGLFPAVPIGAARS